MEVKSAIWTRFDSRAELDARALEFSRSIRLILEDANSCGLSQGENDWSAIIGYPNIGLEPKGWVRGNELLVGMNEFLIMYNTSNMELKFRYQMPTVFHELLLWRDSIIVRDEVGFVGISHAGEEDWKILLNGPIGEYVIDAGKIIGSTIDDDRFEFAIPAAK